MSDKDELEPYPLCHKRDGMTFIRPDNGWRYVQCISCMCSCSARPTRELAVSAWNQLSKQEAQ